jgi:hypothetical protein
METTLLKSLEFDDRFSIEFLYRQDKNPLRVRVTFNDGDASENSFELSMDELTTCAREAIGKCASMAVADWAQWAALSR